MGQRNAFFVTAPYPLFAAVLVRRGRVSAPDEPGPDTVAVPEARPGGGVTADGAESGGRILSSMNRVGCAAKVVQMSRATGSDSLKVLRVVLLLLPILATALASKEECGIWPRILLLEL